MKYALIGAAGYIAPRHMRAIKETGGELIAACDRHDSVGVLDKYFPYCKFFTCPTRFERYLQSLKYAGNPIDYFTICTPNYLHDAHIRMGLHAGANIICEKPMVIKPRNVIPLMREAQIAEKRINVIQQLRLHTAFSGFRSLIPHHNAASTPIHNVELVYRTPRGPWYHQSWKGDKEKSGGLLMNIGIHLFDLLISLFGNVAKIYNVSSGRKHAYGMMQFEKHALEVSWLLSIDQGEPKRTLTVGQYVIDLSQGFEDLHTKSYKEILVGCGLGPKDILPSLELVDILQRY